MNVAIFFTCFALIIILGTVLKVNYGFLALVFGFLITWLYLGDTPSSYIKLFPVTLFWNYGMPIIFYGFANGNGTLNVLGRKVVYKFRNATMFLPLVIALVSIIISASGAGSTGTFIVGPIAWGIGVSAGVNPLMIVVSLWIGTVVGGFLPWTTGGVLHQGWQMQFLGMDIIWRQNIYQAVFGIGVLVVMFLVLRGWRTTGQVDKDVFEKPAPYTREQKITLGFILAIILLLLIPTVLHQFVPGVAVFSWMASNFTVPVTCSMGIIFLCFLHAGDLKEVLKNDVNWNILFVIVLMSQFCGLASSMGVTDTLTTLLQNMPALLIAPLFALIGAALSFCVSASTVLPLLYAMVPALAASAGVSVPAMAIPFIIATSATSVSPISTGGAVCQIGAPKEVLDKLFLQQLVLAIVLCVVVVALTFVGFFSIGA